MIELLATPVEGPQNVPTAPGTAATVAAAAGAVSAHRNPAGPSADRDEADAAEDSVVALLQQDRRSPSICRTVSADS